MLSFATIGIPINASGTVIFLYDNYLIKPFNSFKKVKMPGKFNCNAFRKIRHSDMWNKKDPYPHTAMNNSQKNQYF